MIIMGLLEKADKIKTEEKDESIEESINEKIAEVPPENPPASTEDQKNKPKKSRRERRSRKKRERKQRTPKAKKVREVKKLPEGYELASSGQKVIRRYSDLLTSYGLIIGPFIINILFDSDVTYLLVFGIILTGFNLIFMPRSTGRTVGNWISRTSYITHKNSQPQWAYLTLKGLTFGLVLVGIVFTATSTQDLSTSGGKILFGLGFIILLPTIIDYLFIRFKRDNQGLWDTIFGGVWLVRTTKSAGAKGWLKRLEQLGDYSDEKGWLKSSNDEN